MSEHEDFKAWLKTWALPGNTSREDAMYAAWQARAARTAPAEHVAYRGMPNDFITHQDSWRQAIERLIELEPEAIKGEVDDRAFWRHELAAFDRAYAELEAARTASAEPVAWVTQCRNSGLIEQCEPDEKASNTDWTDAFPVYTAPDALQAEGTTSDKYRAELYDEVWQKARDMGYGNVTDALAAIERLREEVERLTEDRVIDIVLTYSEGINTEKGQSWAKAERLLRSLLATSSLPDTAIDAARTAKPEVDHE